MIRNSLKRTIDATFLVRVPDPSNHDFPTPFGTGFFVSKDGHFVTARHVVTGATDPSGIQLSHHAQAAEIGPVLRNPQLLYSSSEVDLAVLKFDFAAHSAQQWAKERNGFPFLEVDLDEHEEGTPVYSFGYPLPETRLEIQEDEGGTLSHITGMDWICPRVTSAIVSSRWEVLGPVQTLGPSPFYVLDKAFNYGNSGGPIVLQESGKVIAAVVRFQPLEIPQPIAGLRIVIPSLYGVASSLKNWEQGFRNLGLSS